MTPDDPVRVAEGAVEQPADRKPSTWQRLLDNRTGPQRLLISLGALAAALIAIGGVVTAVLGVFDGEGSGGEANLDQAPGETQRIENRTEEANRFVAALLDHDGAVVALDHKVIAENVAADAHLFYNCTDAGVCNMVRIQDHDVVAEEPCGLWLKGCFAVRQRGRGYGAESLDIELSYQGESCP
jgi:hypothetical protein